MPNKLTIKDNKLCQFQTEDNQLFYLLRQYLSYRMTGVEYTPAYRNGNWDGITYLISKKGSFRAGLFPKVKAFLEEQQAEFIVEDKRQPVILNPPIDLSFKLQELGMVPRDYQERIVDATDLHNKGIIRSCTASGKTLATALITAKFNKPTIIYVIGLDLLQQFHDLYSKLFQEPIGFIGNGVCQIERINIASIWTLAAALKIDKKDIVASDEEMNTDGEKELDENDSERIIKMLQDTKVHIFDESHVITTNTILHIYNNIDPENIYGFSGTPFRDDNSNLLIHSILGEQIINISASELIERGVLPQPIIRFVPVPKLHKAGQTYQEVYKNYIAENEIRNNLILHQLQDLLKKKYTPLVLFKQIKHGEILLEMFKEAGIKCEMLYGNDSLDRRTEVKEMLQRKEIDIILSSVIFDIGIDIPPLNALVLAGGGKSSVKVLQRVGRCLRPYAGKNFVAVVDFYDQARFLKAHSMIRYEIYKSEQGFKVVKCKGMSNE